MLEKTMKQVLGKKVKAWLGSITDPEVVKAIEEDLVITGGCFPSMIQNEEPRDFDCYFRTRETTLLVAEYYIGLWNDEHPKYSNKLGCGIRAMVLDGANPSKELMNFYHCKTQIDLGLCSSRMVSCYSKDTVRLILPSDGIAGDPKEVRADEELGTEADPIHNVKEIDEVEAGKIEEREKKDYFPVFISTNAVTLSRGIQIVTRFFGEPDKIHETYDFVHTKAYWCAREKRIVIPRDVYECVVNKALIYTGSLYPVCSVFRLRKFISRGWRINAGQILKMAMQISELDLSDIDVLEDQLVGVDSVYFMQLINQFAKKQTDDPNWKLTTGYVMSVIDKIF